MRRPALYCLLVLASLCAAACRVQAQVHVDVASDGSGVVEVSVELDADAARRLGDPSTALRSGDLTEAGWTVDAPSTSEDGTLVLRATRPFAGPDQLAGVLSEVGGTDGVFGDVSLDVLDGFAQTTYELSARVRLTGSPEQFSDEALASVLDGMALARTPEELAAAGAHDPEAMTLVVSVALPGDVERTDGDVDESGVVTWSFPVTGGEPTDAALGVTAVQTSTRTWLLVAAAALAAVGAGVALVVGLLRRRG